MKNFDDLKTWFSKECDEKAEETITDLLASEVSNKYHLHEEPDSFFSSDDYFDVEAEIQLIDLVVEDSGPQTLLFHACYEVVYDELYCNPHSLVDIYHCYYERGIHGWVVVDFVGYDWDNFQSLDLVPDSAHAISEEKANRLRTEYSDSIIYNQLLLPDLSSDKKRVQAVDIILKRYYPGFNPGLTTIDPEILAESMGLKLIQVPYLPESIEGIIYFEDGSYTSSAPDADLWKASFDDTGNLVPDKLAQYEAKAGTIVLTTSTGDRKNNTLAHECCHWFLHRKPYLLQILLGEEPPTISCRQNTMKGRVNGSYIDQREWQASNLSPKVLLANKPVHETILKMVKTKKAQDTDKLLPDLIREAIEELSSTSTALSRGGILVQLQKHYRGLEGILPCPEHFYIRPYWYDPDRLKRNETFDISLENYELLYNSSADFRFLIDSGLFVFVENHVCRVTPDSVDFDDFELLLTDEARMHMDRYCITFPKETKSSDTYANIVTGAFRYITKDVYDKMKLFNAGNVMPSDEVWEAATKGMQDINDVQSDLTGNLKHDLSILFEWCEKTKYRVSEDADLDKHTFPDLLNGKTKTIKLKTAIQLCIGMQLPYELCKCLLKASNIEFDGSPLHVAYSWIIRHLTYEPIAEANKFLASRNLPLLGRA